MSQSSKVPVLIFIKIFGSPLLNLGYSRFKILGNFTKKQWPRGLSGKKSTGWWLNLADVGSRPDVMLTLTFPFQHLHFRFHLVTGPQEFEVADISLMKLSLHCRIVANGGDLRGRYMYLPELSKWREQFQDHTIVQARWFWKLLLSNIFSKFTQKVFLLLVFLVCEPSWGGGDGAGSPGGGLNLDCLLGSPLLSLYSKLAPTGLRIWNHL